jgi:hypothetical protein
VSRAIISATWDDAPHLSEDAKAELWRSIPPYQRDARSKGVPQLGSGAIYPIAEDDILVDDFPIPPHWRRVYGLDVGWNKTAVVWAAENRDTGQWFLYSEHYRGEAEPIVHVGAVHARGKWVPGVIDPAARGRSQKDGISLLETYRGLGLDLEAADHAVESGIYLVWTLLSSQRLRVFKSLGAWRAEYRLYRRDEKGAIVKANDHLMDATRYLVMSGRDRARAQPPSEPAVERRYVQVNTGGDGGGGWMGS